MANNGSGDEAASAKVRYALNREDVARLLELHGEKGGTERGRRYGLEVLNKSAIVLITAFWEAFCEDLAAEALERLVNELENPTDLPKALQKIIAEELKDDQHNLAIWRLAGDGWRPHVTSRLDALRTKRNWDLMNPRPNQVQKLFADTLGLPDVTKSWKWSGASVTKSCEKLDEYVTLRGDVAHRGTAEESVKLVVVRAYDEFIQKLVDTTDKCVNQFVSETISKASS
ncbi:UNVERIFIED_ORG: hypothetical protein M2328_003531 [Rhodococcus erythropolis]